ncbi:MAG: hypothetical protein EA412_10765 [Chitinophagaceae bacterium]|nr:MAG: hypothetical protein EA412_10765 [Chitinophagaceae bacterium]
MSKEVNILYISMDGMTDPLGQSQVIPYLKGLRKLNYRFTILSFEKKDRFQKNKDIISKILSEADIQWEPLIYTQSLPIFSSIKDLFKGYRKALQIARDIKADIVQARGHHLACMMAMHVKNKTAAAFLYDMRGFWPDERVDGGHWNLKNPVFKAIYTFFKKKESQFFKHSDAMITLTYAAKDYLNTHYGIGEKITVIPCAADLEHFQPAKESDKEVLKSRLNLNDKYIFNISGSIGTWYLPEKMLDFFKVATEEIPNAHLLLVTLDDSTSFLDYARSIGISEDKITITSSSRAEMPVFYSISDAAIFFIKAVFSKKASSPTKHGELLGCRIPVICNGGVGDMNKIMSERHTGEIMEELNEQNFREALKNLLAANYKAEDFSEVAKSYYSLETGIKSYDKAYKICLNKL